MTSRLTLMRQMAESIDDFSRVSDVKRAKEFVSDMLDRNQLSVNNENDLRYWAKRFVRFVGERLGVASSVVDEVFKPAITVSSLCEQLETELRAKPFRFFAPASKMRLTADGLLPLSVALPPAVCMRYRAPFNTVNDLRRAILYGQLYIRVAFMLGSNVASTLYAKRLPFVRRMWKAFHNGTRAQRVNRRRRAASRLPAPDARTLAAATRATRSWLQKPVRKQSYIESDVIATKLVRECAKRRTHPPRAEAKTIARTLVAERPRDASCSLRVATFNCGGRANLRSFLLERQDDLDVILVQESRRLSDGPCTFAVPPGWTLLSQSRSVDLNGGGTAIVFRSALNGSLNPQVCLTAAAAGELEWLGVNLRTRTGPLLCISLYVPPQCRPTHAQAQQLATAINRNRGTATILGGDFNYDPNRMSDPSKRDFINSIKSHTRAAGLRSCNTHDTKSQPTFVRSGNTLDALYTFARSELAITERRTVDSLSDHLAVCGRIRFAPWLPIAKVPELQDVIPAGSRVRWERLIPYAVDGIQMQRAYQHAFARLLMAAVTDGHIYDQRHARQRQLRRVVDACDPPPSVQTLTTVILAAGAETLEYTAPPKLRKRTPRPPWAHTEWLRIHREVTRLRHRYERARQAASKRPLDEAAQRLVSERHQELTAARRSLDKTNIEARDAHYLFRAQNLNGKRTRDVVTAASIVRSLTGKFTAPTHSIEELNAAWLPIFNAPPPHGTRTFDFVTESNAYEAECSAFPEDTIAFTVHEADVAAARKLLKWRKSNGRDGIRNEALKTLPCYVDTMFARLFTRIVNGLEPIPDYWKTHDLVLVPKGAAESALDYRPISLISCFAKLLEASIYCNLRSSDALRGMLPFEQGGFRFNRGTTEQIWTLAMLDQISTQANEPLLCIFFDIQKAFDSVPFQTVRYALMRDAAAGRIPLQLARFLSGWIDGTKKCIKIGNNDVEIPVRRGVPQGGVLSPLLFNLVIRYWTDCLNGEHVIGVRSIAEDAPPDDVVPRVELLGTRLNHLMYADDLCAFARSSEQLQWLTSRSEQWAKAWGLSFAVQKCETTTLGKGRFRFQVFLNDTNVPWRPECRYLGIYMQARQHDRRLRNVKRSDQAKRTLEAARFALPARRNVSAKLLSTLCRTTAEGATMYGAEIYNVDLAWARRLVGLGAKTSLGQWRGVSTTNALRFLGWPEPEVVAAKRRYGFVAKLTHNNQVSLTHRSMMRTALVDPTAQATPWVISTNAAVSVLLGRPTNIPFWELWIGDRSFAEQITDDIASRHTTFRNLTVDIAPRDAHAVFRAAQFGYVPYEWHVDFDVENDAGAVPVRTMCTLCRKHFHNGSDAIRYCEDAGVRAIVADTIGTHAEDIDDAVEIVLKERHNAKIRDLLTEYKQSAVMPAHGAPHPIEQFIKAAAECFARIWARIIADFKRKQRPPATIRRPAQQRAVNAMQQRAATVNAALDAAKEFEPLRRYRNPLPTDEDDAAEHDDALRAFATGTEWSASKQRTRAEAVDTRSTGAALQARHTQTTPTQPLPRLSPSEAAAEAAAGPRGWARMQAQAARAVAGQSAGATRLLRAGVQPQQQQQQQPAPPSPPQQQLLSSQSHEHNDKQNDSPDEDLVHVIIDLEAYDDVERPMHGAPAGANASKGRGRAPGLEARRLLRGRAPVVYAEVVEID